MQDYKYDFFGHLRDSSILASVKNTNVIFLVLLARLIHVGISEEYECGFFVTGENYSVSPRVKQAKVLYVDHGTLESPYIL